MTPPAAPAPPAAFRSSPWGHVLVSAAACALTVSILGSAVFLGYRIYTQYQLRGRIQDFFGALENRTPAELAERAEQLTQRPKLVDQMLPEFARTLRAARSERQLTAAIEISSPFLSHRRVRDALFNLRTDGREAVAAAAIAALARIEPPEQAAEYLARCLNDVPGGAVSPAAVDQLCAGLYDLGGAGLEVMKSNIEKLSVDRRVWLAGYVNATGGPYRRAWLELLMNDTDERVRAAARSALAAPATPRAPKMD